MSREDEPRVLLTSFGPFGGLSRNPSETIMSLVSEEIGGAIVDKVVLPVETATVREILPARYGAGYALVIHTGVALDRPCVSIERIALNLLDFDADERGERRVEVAIEEGAPLALSARLPIRNILERWRAAGIEGRASTSAGTFLCNQVMFMALRALPETTRAGFIHVAPDESLAATVDRFQPAATQARAIELAIEVVLGELRLD
ncbi:MAG: pyroglutamyl-peptidase I [Deltaproteobacteria bacterium]|nr:pyroglutamyl-peptidase I [Deltaproteobacteria bacterium]